jgi:succinate dehydrogenase / fumarate reductase membrane anchor subunit
MADAFRTPLSRVRGHGSAKAGTGHFIGERVSAVILALLAPYLFVSAALGIQPGYEGVRAWVEQAHVAAPLFVFLMGALYHMRLGMGVVIEDYIEKPGTRALLLLLNLIVALALAAGGGYAILYLAMGV